VLAVFAYIGILTGEIAAMEWLAVDEETEEYATWANIALWTLGHLAFAVDVMGWV